MSWIARTVYIQSGQKRHTHVRVGIQDGVAQYEVIRIFTRITDCRQMSRQIV